jgi:hypothetical protein
MTNETTPQKEIWEIRFTSQKEGRHFGSVMTDRHASEAWAAKIFRTMRDSMCYRDLHMVCPDGRIVRN